MQNNEIDEMSDETIQHKQQGYNAINNRFRRPKMPRISKHGGKEAMHSSHVTISIALPETTFELMASR